MVNFDDHKTLVIDFIKHNSSKREKLLEAPVPRQTKIVHFPIYYSP